MCKQFKMDDNDKEIIELLQKKVAVFFDNNIDIHLFYKSGEWARGKIISIDGDSFILDERINGRTPVFFVDLADVQKLRVRKDG